MGRNDLKFVLEAETEDKGLGGAGKPFYRYGLGDFQIWFSQDERNGNIYAAYMHEREDVQNGLEDKFEFYIGTREEARGAYYPNEFQVRPKSYAMDVDEARVFAKDLERACDVMESVKDFFNSGKHFALFAKYHDVPHIKVSAADYLGHVICEGLYRESDTTKAIDIFKSQHAWFGDFPLSVRSVGFPEDKGEAAKKVEDEMISREALMGDIAAYFARQFPGDWNSLSDDCKKVWQIIDNFGSPDVDLISRAALLDAVLNEFGCDLAYFGRDLQFFQDVIVGIPAASEKPLEEKLADASYRSDAENLCGRVRGDNEPEKLM